MPTITIRLSAEEKTRVEDAADAAGVSLSEFVRSALSVVTDNITERTAALEARVAALEKL